MDIKVKTPEGYEFTMPDYIYEVIKNENWQSFGQHSKPVTEF